MKRILLFHYEDQLKPIGGPSGYLYNLVSGIQAVANKSFSVELLQRTKSESSNRARTVYNKLPLWIKTIYRIYGHWTGYRMLSKPQNTIDSAILSQYDYVHFHDCFSLYKLRHLIKDFKGEILLQSHCPKPPQLEKIEDMYTPFERFLYGKRHLKKYTECVRYAYEHADYIIYPCEEAEESYFKHWDEYAQIHDSRKNDIKYIPTGLKDCIGKIKRSKEEVRIQYNIPKDAFVISYIGRHNKVKGYDRLRKIAELLKEQDDIYVIVAGEEYPLTRPNHPRWIEVGWTNDPYSIVNASDVFILPNQETYFDLVLIEILSLGKAAVISRTGGNKYFEKLDTSMKYFDTEEECVSIVSALADDRKKVEEMGAQNRALYLEKFTDNKFAEAYLDLISELD